MRVSGYPTLPVKNGPTLTIFFTSGKKIVFGPKSPQNRIVQDSLLVKRRNNNHSPGSNKKVCVFIIVCYQGPKCPVTQDACFHDLHKILNIFLSL